MWMLLRGFFPFFSFASVVHLIYCRLNTFGYPTVLRAFFLGSSKPQFNPLFSFFVQTFSYQFENNLVAQTPQEWSFELKLDFLNHNFFSFLANRLCVCHNCRLFLIILFSAWTKVVVHFLRFSRLPCLFTRYLTAWLPDSSAAAINWPTDDLVSVHFLNGCRRPSSSSFPYTPKRPCIDITTLCKSNLAMTDYVKKWPRPWPID